MWPVSVACFTPPMQISVPRPMRHVATLLWSRGGVEAEDRMEHKRETVEETV